LLYIPALRGVIPIHPPAVSYDIELPNRSMNRAI